MSIAYSKSQLTSMIWAGEGIFTYALIDGRQIPGLAQRLQGAMDISGWDKLTRGHLDESELAHCGFLIGLLPGTEFSTWLLDLVIEKIPNWGMLMISDRGLIPLRDHCRDLIQIDMPNGDTREWRWYDPQLFQRLAPHWGSDQVDLIFSPFQSLCIPSRETWIWYFKKDDGLAIELRQLAGTSA